MKGQITFFSFYRYSTNNIQIETYKHYKIYNNYLNYKKKKNKQLTTYILVTSSKCKETLSLSHFFFREKPWDKVECKADRTVLNEETVSL